MRRPPHNTLGPAGPPTALNQGIHIPRSVLAATLLALACGKSGDGGPCTTCPAPAIAIGVSTSSLSIGQGGSGSLTATITRSGGFTGAVTIVTEGAPSGVTAAASSVTTSGTVTTGTVTVDVAASVAPGTYNLVVRASGSGVTSVTQGVSLTVTARPAISLALSTGAQSVEQGASGAAITVTITRTNYPGTVDLVVQGAPAGVVAAITPAAATGASASLVVSVGPAVPAATYDLLIRGTGTGVTAATIALSLTVTVPPAFTLAATRVAHVRRPDRHGLRELRCSRWKGGFPRGDPSLAGGGTGVTIALPDSTSADARPRGSPSRGACYL